ncbi:hypothetical protein K9L05_02190 [Candidatus Babeliales bacterium]|nr:hypothetical protein [Candidatus Babeliales bacterium]MCF7899439.1 hypothetical protein [Candidatus Babeliales bacterium]
MKKNILLLLALCLGLNFTAKGMDSGYMSPEILGSSSSHGLFNKYFVYSEYSCLGFMDARYKFIGYDPVSGLYKYKDLLNSDSKLKKALKVAGVTTLATAYWVGVAIILDHFAKTGNWNLPEWMKKHYTAGQLSDFAKKAAIIVKNGTQEHVLTPLASMSKAVFAKTVQFTKTQTPKARDAAIKASKILGKHCKTGYAKTKEFVKTQAPKVRDAIKGLSKKTCQRIAEHFKTKKEMPTCPVTPVYANTTGY